MASKYEVVEVHKDGREEVVARYATWELAEEHRSRLEAEYEFELACTWEYMVREAA